MSTIRQAYDQWADQYDTNANKTRDLEAQALRHVLHQHPFTDVLEIGCGTGKNSEWLVTRTQRVLAVDFSPQMLARAQDKIRAPNIEFWQADVTQPWDFTANRFDLITFSLVLEHIENLSAIFRQVALKIKPGGLVYLGELHPFKQYLGCLARFDTSAGERVELEVYQHHLSEFFACARTAGLTLLDLGEWTDEDDPTGPPRILTLLFKKGTNGLTV